MRSRIVAALLIAVPTAAQAQALPRIAALYPPGARAGTTLDVAVRGGGLQGAREVLVAGSGVKATLNEVNVRLDPDEQRLFQTRCTGCHEMRGPSQISRTADQWSATVDRMIRDRNAPITPEERGRIVNYVTAAARASAGLTARIVVSPDAEPGRREIRIVAADGTSTAFPFEVSRDPEALEVEPNNEPEKAPQVDLPATINGQLGNSDVDCFAFQARKGQRLVFNCSAYRLNNASQAVMFPVLTLTDEKGRQLARNTGYFSLDPLIDWTAPADGKYVIALRDMLYRGSPSSVYRLSAGELPYNTYLYPAGAKRGASAQVTVAGENMTSRSLTVPAGPTPGIRLIPIPEGRLPFAVGEHDEYLEADTKGPQQVTVPVSINGRILTEKEEDQYAFTIGEAQRGTYTFDVLAERIGSPLVGRLTLRNARGQALVTNNGGAGTRDPRIDYTFTQPGDFVLEIADAAGRHSPAHVYRISLGAAVPDLQVALGPDNPNLGPGSSVYLYARVERRVGITGPISLRFDGLPAGVTASPTVIAPGESQSFVILTAAADARPGAFSVARAVAVTEAGGRTHEFPVRPIEVYRINNNVQISYREQSVISVGPESGWTLRLQADRTKLSREGPGVTVTAILDRRGSDREIPFALVGIPQGVQGPRSLLFRRGQNELSFTLAPSNGGVFSLRPDQAPRQFLLAAVNGREGEGMMMSSPAIAIALDYGPAP